MEAERNGVGSEFQNRTATWKHYSVGQTEFWSKEPAYHDVRQSGDDCVGTSDEVTLQMTQIQSP